MCCNSGRPGSVSPESINRWWHGQRSGSGRSSVVPIRTLPSGAWTTGTDAGPGRLSVSVETMPTIAPAFGQGIPARGALCEGLFAFGNQIPGEIVDQSDELSDPEDQHDE